MKRIVAFARRAPQAGGRDDRKVVLTSKPAWLRRPSPTIEDQGVVPKGVALFCLDVLWIVRQVSCSEVSGK